MELGANRLRRPWAAVFPLALAVGCGYQPDTPTFTLAASAETFATLDGADGLDARRDSARIAGGLDLFFGTSSSPGYYLLDDWVEEEHDPNDAYWSDLTDADVDDLREGNEVLFRAQLDAVRAAIESGERVAVPRTGSGHAWARWSESFAAVIDGSAGLADLHPDSPELEDASDDDPAFTYGDEALRFWLDYYPSLAESGELYRVRCLTCHGASGAGDGPTGLYLDPRPRDFRKGIFKWVTVEAKRRPTRKDLLRVLTNGVRGSAMPSFRRLSRGELEGLVDWVRFLSVRGETEQLSAYFAVQEERVTTKAIERAYGMAWRRWDEAQDHVVPVPSRAPMPSEVNRAMIERGRELYLGQKAACSTCHGPNGLGDGDAIWEVDEDGERVRRPDEWGHPSAPRNLTSGVFRGGGRPIDLFRRIKNGIGGSIMPAADASLTDDDIWSLVYFVLSLKEEAL